MDTNFDDFGDFDFSNNDFDEDTQLGVIEEAELKILEAIKKYTEMTEESIKFKETQDIQTNFRILSRYITSMDFLLNTETEDMTEDDLLEAINNIENSVIEVRTADLFGGEDVNKDSIIKAFNDKEENDNDDGSLDF